MKISESEVRYVADLANLKLSDAEIQRFSRDLDQILTHVEALKELDTTDVQPMAQVLHEAAPEATLRPDTERPVLGNMFALANAPVAGAGFFKVPKVVER